MSEEEFGRQLRAYRLKRKRTQAHVAAQSGVTLRTYAYWEAGQHTPGNQELEALVRALGLAPDERQVLITLLPAGKVGKLFRAKPAWTDMTAPPGTGDLIRALRWRRRLSRVELARALRVDRTTVARWEESRAIPDEETRLRLCEALDALPEEQVVLLAWSHNAPLWDSKAPTLDACREEAARLERGSGREMNPLFDLRAHLLAGTLWHLTARQPQARLLLAQTYAARAVYACLRGDDSVALDGSKRSLALIKAEDALPKSTLYLALWASGQARAYDARHSGAEQNLREAKEWLLRTQSSRPPAFLLMNTARWALEAGSLREAQEYGRAAHARAERSGAISVHVWDGILSLQAQMLVVTGRHEAGLEKFSEQSGAAYYHPITNHLFQTSAFLKVGARKDADNSLRRAYTLIAADQADFFRKEADGYAAQLERAD